MPLRHKREQGFVAQPLAPERWALLTSRGQGDIQLSSFDAPRDAGGNVLHDFERHLRIMVLECDDQFRKHIWCDGRNRAYGHSAGDLAFELIDATASVTD